MPALTPWPVSVGMSSVWNIAVFLHEGSFGTSTTSPISNLSIWMRSLSPAWNGVHDSGTAKMADPGGSCVSTPPPGKTPST